MNHLPLHELSELGGHYHNTDLQPWDALEKWRNPDHMRGGLMLLILKYIQRYPSKGGVDDLRKARNCIDKLIRFECKIEGRPLPEELQK